MNRSSLHPRHRLGHRRSGSPLRQRSALLVWVSAQACTVELPTFQCAPGGTGCFLGTEVGRCERAGYCSFADAACEATGHRYGRYAPSALQEECVERSGAFVEGDVFFDPLIWLGEHAAALPGGATAVWWDTDAWDVRTHAAVDSHGSGAYVHVRKGAEEPTSGVLVDRTAFGGDGSAGVGVMHVEGTAVASARLRNPALIQVGRPLVVELYASRFVTKGHWWELAITPAETPVGAEHTALATDAMLSTEALNVSLRGVSDTPCIQGWTARLQAVRIDGAQGRRESRGVDIAVDPSERDWLTQWRFTFSPGGVTVAAGMPGQPGRAHLADLWIPIPWSRVHVQLIAVARAGLDLQSDTDCDDGGAGSDLITAPTRGFIWRHVRVQPVAHARTRALPSSAAETGWMSYDLRDTVHIGEHNGRPQPNSAPYTDASAALCSDSDAPPCTRPPSEQTLQVDLPSTFVASIAEARLVYDVRGRGAAHALINGTPVGGGSPLPTAETVPEADERQWVVRSAPIPPEVLTAGMNELTVQMQEPLRLDRLHLELGYGDHDAAR